MTVHTTSFISYHAIESEHTLRDNDHMGMWLQTNCDPDSVHGVYVMHVLGFPGRAGAVTCGSLVSVDSCARVHVTSVGGDKFEP